MVVGGTGNAWEEGCRLPTALDVDRLQPSSRIARRSCGEAETRFAT